MHNTKHFIYLPTIWPPKKKVKNMTIHSDSYMIMTMTMKYEYEYEYELFY